MQSPRPAETPDRDKVPALAAKQPATSFRANNGPAETPAHQGVSPYNLTRFRNRRTTLHSPRQSLLCRFEDVRVETRISVRMIKQFTRSSVEAGTARRRWRFRSRQLEQPNLNFGGGRRLAPPGKNEATRPVQQRGTG